MGVLRVALCAATAALAFGSSSCALDPGAPGPAPGSPSRAAVDDLLSRVEVVPARPDVPGYERGCRAGQACVFGPSWSDDHSGRGGHDGCDTRNNVLSVDLTDVVFRQGTHDCVVVSGTLADPYSGQRIDFTKQDANAVQIDHVYPLAAAWDLGAAAWSPELRRDFANDITYNLLAVDGPENQAKSDSTPSQWLPPEPASHCFYVGKYLSVAVRYGLPITAADRDTIETIAARCP
ncbi:HNH endonuclease family protein [Rhodococcus spongiicola]|uniref:HNH endonuclease n=1 Tax=Rhodococcus spongiicola TaxID=2487352 RepID=A0A3S3AE71_9NOCA|nr:HNH endonuclease family protein [Rhodococcus spongiicola]RVW05960.1 HNH endonuclease [Rhodococcus spongiicola]